MCRRTLFGASLIIVALTMAYDSPVSAQCCAFKPDLSLLGKSAPNFAITDMKGKPIALAQLHGRVVLLEFSNSNDGRYEALRLKHLKDLNAKYGNQGLTVVGMVYGGTESEELKKKISDEKIHFTLVPGDPEIAGKYRVRSLPTTYLIDRDRNVVEIATSYADLLKLDKRISELIRTTGRAGE